MKVAIVLTIFIGMAMAIPQQLRPQQFQQRQQQNQPQQYQQQQQQNQQHQQQQQPQQRQRQQLPQQQQQKQPQQRQQPQQKQHQQQQQQQQQQRQQQQQFQQQQQQYKPPSQQEQQQFKPPQQQYQPQQYQPQQFQQQVTNSKDAFVLKHESQNDGSGLYSYGFETSDGQARQEQGVLKNPGTDDEALSVTGSFSFLAPDGVVYTVRYIADENGFRPEGDHIPRRTPALGIPSAALGSLVGGGIGKK